MAIFSIDMLFYNNHIKQKGKDEDMEIYALRTNGKKNPTGEEFSRLVFSWKVRNGAGKKQTNASVMISKDSHFSEICYREDGADFSGIAHPVKMTCEPGTRYYWKVEITTDAGEKAVSPAAFFETSKFQDKWTGNWISTQEDDLFHPEFARDFSVREGWTGARLYITGLGVFEAFLNGEKVGADYLAPFLTDYRDGVQYCTYDVTDLIGAENRLAVILGNGWYKGRYGLDGKEARFGDRFLLKAELHIFYPEGEEIVAATDTDWMYSRSFVEESGIYDGEIQNYCTYSSEPSGWKHAVKADGPQVISRYSLPLKAHEVFPVREILHTPTGETVLDFGQNFAGYVEFSGAMEKGEILELHFGEILQDNAFYQGNYRSARAEFAYRSDGIRRIVRPHFTYYGFRYVKVEMKSPVRPEDFKGVAVYSDVERTGSFRSSNDLLNRLYDNTVWGLKSNFVDMPTDCPQRDERLGWTGDAQVFSGTASYHVDTRAFYEKYLKDLRKDQIRNDGKVALYLPNFHPGMTASGWSDAASILPMVLYRYYGDRELLREFFPLMKEWVDHIHREDCNRGRQDLWNFGFQFGDWLALDGVTPTSKIGATDIHFIASVYYCHSAQLVAEAAAILNLEMDALKYRKLADRIREQILYHYFTPSGLLAVDTQTACYISLYFGIYRSKEKVVESLKKRLKKDCYQIRSGFIGTPIMCNVLADAGLFDIACDYLFNEGYPGWLYEVKQGATTIWERWNSVLPDGRISDTGMNSLNHYAYGSVAEFLYRYIAGIQPVSPGFQTVRIAPQFTSELDWADCSYDSAAGTYRVRWELLENREVRVLVEIPFGAKGLLCLPDYGKNGEELDAGSYVFQYRTVRDYRCRYRPDSRLSQMKDDNEVLQIADQCDGFRLLLEGGNPEVLSQSLDELRRNVLSGLSLEEAGKAIDEILKIRN